MYNVNSQAVGMDSWVQSALKSILRGEPISESAAWFFVIILKFIFTSIFEIKIHEKNSLTPKKFHFRRPIFINLPTAYTISNPDSLGVKIYICKIYFYQN